MSIASRTSGRLATYAGRTQAAIRLAASRRDSFGVFAGVTVGYLLIYLWAIQHLRIRRDVEAGIVWAAEPTTAMMRRTGPASWDTVALIDTGVVRLLFSPINTGIGFALAVLVGVSIALTYLALVQPRACGMGASSGFLAAIPALVGGSACCVPVVALVLGIQLTGTMMTMFAWALPVAVAMLVGSILYIGGKIDVNAVNAVG